jgi:hypothetical protein
MNRRKHMLLAPLALVAVFALGAADAAPPANGAQPWGPAAAAKPGAQGNGSGHWGEHFQGRGNVTNTRCQGMSRGANCITAASRKEAAQRAAAARADAAGSNNDGGGGQ